MCRFQTCIPLCYGKIVPINQCYAVKTIKDFTSDCKQGKYTVISDSILKRAGKAEKGKCRTVCPLILLLRERIKEYEYPEHDYGNARKLLQGYCFMQNNVCKKTSADRFSQNAHGYCRSGNVF